MGAKGTRGGPSQGVGPRWAGFRLQYTSPTEAPSGASGSRGAGRPLGCVGPKWRRGGGKAAPPNGVSGRAVGPRGANHTRSILTALWAPVSWGIMAGCARDQPRSVPPGTRGAGEAGRVPSPRVTPGPAGRAHIPLRHVEHTSQSAAIGKGGPSRASGIDGTGDAYGEGRAWGAVESGRGEALTSAGSG